jgi:hypothetical protein
MDISTVVIALIVAMGVPSAITGFGFWLLERKIQQRDDEAKREAERRRKEEEERDEKRRQYEMCQLNMTTATMALAEATAMAVQRIPDAQCNGDMHKALDYATEIKNEQKAFLKKQAIKSIDF